MTHIFKGIANNKNALYTCALEIDAIIQQDQLDNKFWVMSIGALTKMLICREFK